MLRVMAATTMNQPNVLAVAVPENSSPGDILLVLAPDGSGRTVSARVPEGCGAGHVFFVSFAPPVVAVTGVPVEQPLVVNALDQYQQTEQDLELVEETNEQAADMKDIVLVTVPEGSKPGDKIRVQLPDQRIVEAVVPEGNVKQFYVQGPPSNGTSRSLPAFV